MAGGRYGFTLPLPFARSADHRHSPLEPAEPLRHLAVRGYCTHSVHEVVRVPRGQPLLGPLPPSHNGRREVRSFGTHLFPLSDPPAAPLRCPSLELEPPAFSFCGAASSVLDSAASGICPLARRHRVCTCKAYRKRRYGFFLHLAVMLALSPSLCLSLAPLALLLSGNPKL